MITGDRVALVQADLPRELLGEDRLLVVVVDLLGQAGDLAAQAVRDGSPLPRTYYKLFWLWFAFGFPAFAAVTAIFWLMIVRPPL